MASYRILSVGQCKHDHARLSRFLESEFQAEVERAESASEALQTLRNEHVDLVLVNRVFGRDASRGLDLVKAIVADPELRRVPVMLVSNYPEAQQMAVEAGAHEGFGKAALRTARTRELLSEVLHGAAASTGR